MISMNTKLLLFVILLLAYGVAGGASSNFFNDGSSAQRQHGLRATATLTKQKVNSLAARKLQTVSKCFISLNISNIHISYYICINVHVYAIITSFASHYFSPYNKT